MIENSFCFIWFLLFLIFNSRELCPEGPFGKILLWYINFHHRSQPATTESEGNMVILVIWFHTWIVMEALLLRIRVIINKHSKISLPCSKDDSCEIKLTILKLTNSHVELSLRICTDLCAFFPRGSI